MAAVPDGRRDGAGRKRKREAVSTAPAQAPPAAAGTSDGAVPEPVFRNKEKVLVLSSRGTTFRSKHLMMDMVRLLPHSKKDNKLDTKSDRAVLNEVADMKSCTSVLFFEARKGGQDLFLWVSKPPRGPSAKFLVQNAHTMSELKLTGNHLMGSRPILSFDATFDAHPHLQLLKELFTQVFATPRRHRRSKPFLDHVMSFSVADGRVWFRNYQLAPPPGKHKIDAKALALVEVGPRFCLNPIRIFAGSFGGPPLYHNPEYMSPNAVRAQLRQRKARRYSGKVAARQQRKQHMHVHALPKGELDDVFKQGS